jgi:hypothetical protein
LSVFITINKVSHSMTHHLLIKLRFKRDYGSKLLPALLLACLACAPLYAQQNEGDEAGPHMQAAELALENNEYKLAATEYRKAAELSGNTGIAK